MFDECNYYLELKCHSSNNLIFKRDIKKNKISTNTKKWNNSSNQL